MPHLFPGGTRVGPAPTGCGTAWDGADWHGTHGWRPVVRLDMSRSTPPDPAGMHHYLQRQMMHQVDLWERRGVPWDGDWKRPLRDDPPGDILMVLLDTLGEFYGADPVVLVDEYDAPVTHYLGRNLDLAPALDALRELYRVLKDDAGLLYGVLVTGITRLAKPHLFSAANNFTDISDDPAMSALCGFTEDEVEVYLWDYRQALRELKTGFDEASVLDAWRDMYNGYRFALNADAERIYNPYTLIHGLDRTLRVPAVRALAAEGLWPSAWSETAHPALAVRLAADTHQPLPPRRAGGRAAAARTRLGQPAATRLRAPHAGCGLLHMARRRGRGRTVPGLPPTTKWRIHGSTTSWICGMSGTAPGQRTCSMTCMAVCMRAMWTASSAAWRPSIAESPTTIWIVKPVTGPSCKPCAAWLRTMCRRRRRHGADAPTSRWRSAVTSMLWRSSAVAVPPPPCAKSGTVPMDANTCPTTVAPWPWVWPSARMTATACIWNANTNPCASC